MFELKINVVKNFAKGGLTSPPAVGWSRPEDAFVWNDGDMSTIWFAAETNEDLVKLAFVLAPNINKDSDQGQRMQVFLNGILIGYKRFDTPGFQGADFTFPGMLLRTLNKLDFVFLDAERPAKVGGSDQRRLAAAFESVQLVVA